MYLVLYTMFPRTGLGGKRFFRGQHTWNNHGGNYACSSRLVKVKNTVRSPPHCALKAINGFIAYGGLIDPLVLIGGGTNASYDIITLVLFCLASQAFLFVG